jgi:hypothetical protein
MNEILSNKLHLLSTFDKLNKNQFKLIKNNKKEILYLVEEVCNVFENQVNDKHEERILEKLFWSKFIKNKLTKKKLTKSGFEDKEEINANICLKFLEQNKHLF